MNDPQTIDPRRRIRELLAIPDRDRTDAEWDELNELEIRTAPGNRTSGHPDYYGQSERGPGKRQGQPGQPGANKKRKDKHPQGQGQGQKNPAPRPQEARPEGSGGAGGGGNNNRPSKRQHRRHKQRQGGEGGGNPGGAQDGGAPPPSGNAGGESAA